MKKEIICTVCPRGCHIMVEGDGEKVLTAEGYSCKRGLEYAKKELTRPERTVTSTVRVCGGKANVVSVRPAGDVPKDAIFRVMEAINAMTVPAPVKIGDVLCADIAGTGVALTATKGVAKK